MDFVDLHVHSNASDGTCSPSQVVELAKNAGLDAFALTDHDTTAGVPEALEKGRDLNIEVIPGIEVSSSFDGTEIHILGLFVNSDDPVLAAMLEKMRISRDRRNEKMLENLAADGISFTKEELCGDNPDTIITRAHIAHALVAKGICSGMDQAFKKYLQYGGRYCPQKEHLSPEEVVKTLISNGAFVALAHPFQYKFGDKKTEELIAHMADLGMKGLEVYHSSNNKLESMKLQEMAVRHHLLPTGGSDFHGGNKPDISIGTGRGGLTKFYPCIRVSSLL
mgnify:CR=1 FL=1